MAAKAGLTDFLHCRDMVAPWDGQIVVLKEEAYRIEGFDTSVKHGTLRLTHRASPFANERD